MEDAFESSNDKQIGILLGLIFIESCATVIVLESTQSRIIVTETLKGAIRDYVPIYAWGIVMAISSLAVLVSFITYYFHRWDCFPRVYILYSFLGLLCGGTQIAILFVHKSCEIYEILSFCTVLASTLLLVSISYGNSFFKNESRRKTFRQVASLITMSLFRLYVAIEFAIEVELLLIVCVGRSEICSNSCGNLKRSCLNNSFS
eukprot:TRINITY_DN5103_c0_g1_i1.p1 TRINITY_DN5103_c0_g1~~TRINITY_DN5103_c0_g1_i1.p1  ORF type:complete len:204 (-),score=-8.04 TRINITY_DN5103_c0_g1_i1:452-1063(-)